MCTYLSKRSSTYYFRRVIPVDLRPAFDDRSAFMVSLRTKDREEAKRLIPAHTAKSNQELDDARMRLGKGAMSAPGKAAQGRSAFGHGITPWQIEQAEMAAQDSLEQEERQEAREAERAYWRKRLSFTTRELTPSEAAVKDLVGQAEFEADVARAQIASLRAELREAKAARNPDLVGKAPVPAAPTAPVAAPDKGVMLDTDLIELWAAERKPVQKGKDTHRAVAEWFYQRVGRIPVGQITRAHVQKFKNALVEEGQSAANIKMKLSRLRTLLQWAFDNDYAKANEAHGVSIRDTEAARNKRREFDLASLNRIFASPIYSEGLRPAGGKGEAAYWLPLLALYTGARLEELGQLRPGDVEEIAYPDASGVEQRHWFIRIKEDEGDGLTLKNAGSERDVPVHPELARLGFLSFVAAAQSNSQARLFPMLRPNVYGRLTAKWGEWFGPYLRNTCGVTDKRMVFHSFRHTFKHYARHVGMPEGVQRQIMGHSSGDVADTYGSGYSPHQVVEGMKLFNVAGLETPRLVIGMRESGA